MNYSLCHFEFNMIYNFVFLHKFSIYLFTALALNMYSLYGELLLILLTYIVYFHRHEPNVWPNFTRQLKWTRLLLQRTLCIIRLASGSCPKITNLIETTIFPPFVFSNT